MSKSKSGELGEIYAARYLRKKGYAILAANFKSKFGEIDIIAALDLTIAFVEVKTRSENSISTPGESVGYQKQSKIVKTALIFLSVTDVKKYQPRFDVVEVIMDEYTYDKPKINHIENAFTAEGMNAFF